MQVELSKKEVELLVSSIEFLMKPLTVNDPFLIGLINKLNNAAAQVNQPQIPMLEIMG